MFTSNQVNMFSEFHRIMRKQENQMNLVSEFVSFWSEVFGEQVFTEVADALIVEFRPHIFGKEVITTKEGAFAMSIDPQLIQFANGGYVSDVKKEELKKRFALPPMKVVDSVDEFTLYQLSAMKAQQ